MSPEPYRDDDPAPLGSPRLFGDIGVLSGRRTSAELRGLSSPGMTAAERKRFRLKMMIAIAYHSGMPQTWIAEALGKTQSVISDVCIEIEDRLKTDSR